MGLHDVEKKNDDSCLTIEKTVQLLKVGRYGVKSSRDMNVQLVNVDGTESNRDGTQHETDKEGIDELKGRKWIGG